MSLRCSINLRHKATLSISRGFLSSHHGDETVERKYKPPEFIGHNHIYNQGLPDCQTFRVQGVVDPPDLDYPYQV